MGHEAGNGQRGKVVGNQAPVMFFLRHAVFFLCCLLLRVTLGCCLVSIGIESSYFG